MNQKRFVVVAGMVTLTLLAGCGQREGYTVKNLVGQPAIQAKTVEVPAYTWWRSVGREPNLPQVLKNAQGCFDMTQTTSVLVDQPVPRFLNLLGGGFTNTELNFEQTDVAWLLPVSEQPLPYHAQYRGHLNDPLYAHCPYADHIFVIDDVVSVYEQDYPYEDGFAPVKVPKEYQSWSTYNDGELGFRFLYPQNWKLSQQQGHSEDEAAIQIVPVDRTDISIQVIVHKGELAFDPFNPENSSDLMKDSGYSYYEIDKVPLDRQVERQNLTVYNLVFRDPKQPNLSSFLIRGDGYSLEFRMQYPIGLSASQEIMDTLSSVVVSTNMDKQPGIMPTVEIKRDIKTDVAVGQSRAQTTAEGFLNRDTGMRVEKFITAALVSEAQARDSFISCRSFSGHPDAVWQLTFDVTHQEQQTRGTFVVFVDAITNTVLCGDWQSTMLLPTMVATPSQPAPTEGAYPAPSAAPFPTATRP